MFYEDTLKALSSMGMEEVTVESSVSSLIMRLLGRMCNGPQDGKSLVMFLLNFYVSITFLSY